MLSRYPSPISANDATTENQRGNWASVHTVGAVLRKRHWVMKRWTASLAWS
jgi:hypothetical protein